MKTNSKRHVRAALTKRISAPQLLLVLIGLNTCWSAANAQTPALPGAAGRPSFLPPAETAVTVERRSTDLEPALPMADEGSRRVMLAQIEVPIPDPVSDAPNIPLQEQHRHGAVVFEEGQAGLRPRETKPAAPDPGELLATRQYAQLEPIVLKSHDNELAAAIGWSHFNDRSYGDAVAWFSKAIQWDENNFDAAYGLALTYFKTGDFAKAEELARWRMSDDERMRNLLGDMVSARAVAAYKEKKYSESRDLYDQVKGYRPLTRDEQIVQAWNTYNAGSITIAAVEFQRLYDEKPDRFSASGVYATLAQSRDWARLSELARTKRGPLGEVYEDHAKARYYDRGLLLNAYASRSSAETSEKYATMQNIDTATVSGGLGIRSKTGTSGLSQLREISGGVSGSMVVKDVHRISATATARDLESGRVSPDAKIGRVPREGETGFRHATKTNYSSLVDVRLKYEREGEFTPVVELGISPAGGEISSTIVGSAGVKAVQDWGGWSATLYRESIRESILSYTGIVDPYSGQAWGRVSETGARLSVGAFLAEDWSLGAATTFGYLDGENVDDNAHFRVNVSLAKNIQNPNFEYLTIGPSITFEHFEKNLSHFTFGHGGYFSPESLVQGYIGAQFLTKQGRNYLVRGDVGLGLQSYTEADAAYLPLEPDGRTHAGSSSQTAVVFANLEAITLISDRWAVGASLHFNRTGDYNEFAGDVSLKYFFEPRAGLFASDL